VTNGPDRQTACKSQIPADRQSRDSSGYEQTPCHYSQNIIQTQWRT